MDPFREGLLEGQVALVTGGGSGINLGIAERFVDQGARCILVGRTQEKLDRAAAALAERSGREDAAVGCSADVRDPEALAGAIATGLERLGAELLDVVIAGAAGNFVAPAVGISPNGFAAVVDIDLKGTFHTFRLAFDKLRKPGGRLIAISATQSFVPMPFQAHVCAAKSGIDQLVRVLAIEWGPLGVRVNAVAPGPVEGTEGMRRLSPGDSKRKLERAIPLGRYAAIREIADTVLFLVSDAAAYVTGHVFVVDGGQSLLGAGPVLELFGA